MVSAEEAQKIDEEIRRRTEMIGAFPRVITERVKSMGLTPGKIEIMIKQLDGLFIEIKRET